MTTTTTNTGGVQPKGRQGRGPPCCCDAEGGDGDSRRTGEAAQAARAVQWRQRHWTSRRAHFRQSPHETEGRPGERRRLRLRGWRRHDLPAHGRGGRGGWWWLAAWEREKGGGERQCGHEGAREEAKTIERREEVPFYRRGEGAGHGRGRNGDGKHGRRPWKVAGNGAAVPGD
jgi:hypothetical protein